MISENLKILIRDKIERVFFKKVEITTISPLSGGCINKCFKLKTNIGIFFVKINSIHLFPKMFEAETKGLQTLRSTNTLYIPRVIAFGEGIEERFLILEFIEPGPQKKNFFEDFGKMVAMLHKNSAGFFGLDHNNYVGSLTQSNRQQQSWIDFFKKERLSKQIEFAVKNGVIGSDIIRKFEILFKRMNEFFPEEKPSLVPGDLWNGNFMVTAEGGACLIDPAIYYGFREMDIAMTKLFGGFSSEFYESYQLHFPMEKGWEERIDLCNLYPLMVHVNLFGGRYLQEVKSILRKYT